MISQDAAYRALSIRQPWAWAVLHGGKDVENRGWRTSYRGRFWVHAAKLPDKHAHLRPEPDELVFGAIIGSIELLDCVRDSTSQWASPGAWHWLLVDPRPLVEPVPMKGTTTLFYVPEHLHHFLTP